MFGACKMRWRFDCFVCGERWEEEHRHLEKYHFMFSEKSKKEGRPVVDCYKCKIEFIYTPIVGDMVGNRSWNNCRICNGCFDYDDCLGNILTCDFEKVVVIYAFGI